MTWLRALCGARVFKLVSVRLALVALVIFLLQIVPIFALIGLFPLQLVLSVMVSPLLQLALLALFIESLMGRVPTMMFLVPVAMYGAYFAVLLYERSVLVPNIETELGLQNSGIFTFDTANETLHNDSGLDAEEMLIAYDLPRIFDTVISLPSIVELAAPERCRQTDGLGIGYPHWSRVFYRQRMYCVKREYRKLPVVPMLTISMTLTVVTKDPIPRYDDTYALDRNGEVVGHFTQSNLDLLSLWPQFAIGCGLWDFPNGWHCGLNFNRDIYGTDGVDAPPRRDGPILKHTVDAVRIAAMLRLRHRSDAELDAIAIVR